jgi:hypothetical protein
LQHENHVDDRLSGGSFGISGLLARARNRTEQEQGYSASESTSPYVSAALGQTPYVAVGNGAIVVQLRGCGNWNC